MYTVNQKVKVNQFYHDNYPAWKADVGTVIKVMDVIQVKANLLSKEERSNYLGKFGKQDTYTLHCMLVQFDNDVCLVSDLGVEPA